MLLRLRLRDTEAQGSISGSCSRADVRFRGPWHDSCWADLAPHRSVFVVVSGTGFESQVPFLLLSGLQHIALTRVYRFPQRVRSTGTGLQCDGEVAEIRARPATLANPYAQVRNEKRIELEHQCLICMGIVKCALPARQPGGEQLLGGTCFGGGQLGKIDFIALSCARHGPSAVIAAPTQPLVTRPVYKYPRHLIREHNPATRPDRE